MSTSPYVPMTVEDAAPPLDDLAGELLHGLESVERLPVAGHVGVYEAAHDRMRTALTTPTDAGS